MQQYCFFMFIIMLFSFLEKRTKKKKNYHPSETSAILLK